MLGQRDSTNVQEHDGALQYYEHREKILPSQSTSQLQITITSEAANCMTSSLNKDAKPEGRLSSEKWDTTTTSISQYTNLQVSLSKCSSVQNQKRTFS